MTIAKKKKLVPTKIGSNVRVTYNVTVKFLQICIFGHNFTLELRKQLNM